MSLSSLLIRFTFIFMLSYFVVTVLVIFTIPLLQLPPFIETLVPYVLVWVVSFNVLNQYNEKNRRILFKNQRWKLIFFMTLSALLINIAFSVPIYSADLASDIQRLLLGVLFALPAYAVLVWSAEYRSAKRLLENYPELKIVPQTNTQSDSKPASKSESP